MAEQQIKMELKDINKNTIGFLYIKALDKTKNESENFKLHDNEFTNIPRVGIPDNKTPIQYLDNRDSESLSHLMLLEETKYDVMFETSLYSLSNDEIIIFPTIKKQNTLRFPIFDKSKFDLSTDSISRTIGILNFHSYVGKSFFDVEVDNYITVPIPLEVRSKKIKYYEQYPKMIADLSEIASGLVYEMNSPLYQNMDFDNNKRKTLYEDFMFIEYLFRPENLPNAYDYIVRNLYTQLNSYLEDVPATFAHNIGPSDLIDIITRPEHLYKTNTPPNDWPKMMGGYVPDIISQRFYQENIDTPENRLLKYFLESLDKTINNLLISIDEKDGYIKDQLLGYHELVQDYLSDRWTKEVGPLEYLPSNSQVLQKKEGYRDIFKYYLNYQLAFRLEWQEIEDQIKGYERKLSELYEYWCYFKLIKVLDKLSGKEITFTDIYELNKNKWSIKVKRGIPSIQKFKFQIENQEIHAELMYNRLFSQKTHFKSYSLPFKPDYTLIIQINTTPHLIHFDAKYQSEGQILSYYEQIGTEQLTEKEENEITEKVEKRDQEEETYKKFKYGDLYKMHTYKDAILKTDGAYVLYPGDDTKIFKVTQEEPIPSVGAFPLTPGKNGTEEQELTTFINKILKNLIKQDKI